MKAQLYSEKGEKMSHIELPKVFSTPIREDISQKYFEVIRFLTKHKNAPYAEAGRRHSASGTISHLRHDWKGHYGKGISRVPRKTMWRRGTQFFWIAAEVSGTRGGRRAHPPKTDRKSPKINDKEVQIAMNSAIASSFSSERITKRYSSIGKLEFSPSVIESLPSKSKELSLSLEKIFGKLYHLLYKNKSVRAGKGKRRGRKYKSNSGLLIVTGSKEKSHFSGLDIKPIDEIEITDLFPLGRLALYTKKAIEEIAGENK